MDIGLIILIIEIIIAIGILIPLIIFLIKLQKASVKPVDTSIPYHLLPVVPIPDTLNYPALHEVVNNFVCTNIPTQDPQDSTKVTCPAGFEVQQITTTNTTPNAPPSQCCFKAPAAQPNRLETLIKMIPNMIETYYVNEGAVKVLEGIQKLNKSVSDESTSMYEKLNSALKEQAEALAKGDPAEYLSIDSENGLIQTYKLGEAPGEWLSEDGTTLYKYTLQEGESFGVNSITKARVLYRKGTNGDITEELLTDLVDKPGEELIIKLSVADIKAMTEEEAAKLLSRAAIEKASINFETDLITQLMNQAKKYIADGITAIKSIASSATELSVESAIAAIKEAGMAVISKIGTMAKNVVTKVGEFCIAIKDGAVLIAKTIISGLAPEFAESIGIESFEILAGQLGAGALKLGSSLLEAVCPPGPGTVLMALQITGMVLDNYNVGGYSNYKDVGYYTTAAQAINDSFNKQMNEMGVQTPIIRGPLDLMSLTNISLLKQSIMNQFIYQYQNICIQMAGRVMYINSEGIPEPVNINDLQTGGTLTGDDNENNEITIFITEVQAHAMAYLNSPSGQTFINTTLCNVYSNGIFDSGSGMCSYKNKTDCESSYGDINLILNKMPNAGTYVEWINNKCQLVPIELPMLCYNNPDQEFELHYDPVSQRCVISEDYCTFYGLDYNPSPDAGTNGAWCSEGYLQEGEEMLFGKTLTRTGEKMREGEYNVLKSLFTGSLNNWSACDSNQIDLGLVCMDKCDPDYNNIAGICWLKPERGPFYRGIGTVLQNEGCYYEGSPANDGQDWHCDNWGTFCDCYRGAGGWFSIHRCHPSPLGCPAGKENDASLCYWSCDSHLCDDTTCTTGNCPQVPCKDYHGIADYCWYNKSLSYIPSSYGKHPKGDPPNSKDFDPPRTPLIMNTSNTYQGEEVGSYGPKQISRLF